MANARFAIDGILGANVDDRPTTAVHALGTTARGSNNEIYVYCQANGSVATGTCTLTTDTWQLTDAAGNFTADVAFADNEFGWVRQTADLAA